MQLKQRLSVMLSQTKWRKSCIKVCGKARPVRPLLRMFFRRSPTCFAGFCLINMLRLANDVRCFYFAAEFERASISMTSFTSSSTVKNTVVFSISITSGCLLQVNSISNLPWQSCANICRNNLSSPLVSVSTLPTIFVYLTT